MEPKVIHVRLPDVEGFIGEPIATIAFVKKGDRELRAAIAICSRKDKFIKRMGRAKALGRLKSFRESQTFDSLEDMANVFCEEIVKVRNKRSYLSQSGKALAGVLSFNVTSTANRICNV